MRRSPERTQFLADILTTAVEGGINYWAEVSDYTWDFDNPGVAFVRVYCIEDDDVIRVDAAKRGDLTPPEGVPVDIEKIAKAIARILDPQIPTDLSATNVKMIRDASKENDAGDVDADLADCIMQVAVLGDVIYG